MGHLFPDSKCFFFKFEIQPKKGSSRFTRKPFGTEPQTRVDNGRNVPVRIVDERFVRLLLITGAYYDCVTTKTVFVQNMHRFHFKI